mgnify:CR=1 FL=1
MKLTVNLGADSYPIYIENHILEHALTYISEIFSGKRIMIISDDQVYPRYGSALKANLEAQYECFHLELPHGETTKNFKTLPCFTVPCWTPEFPVATWSLLLAEVSSATWQDLPPPAICAA